MMVTLINGDSQVELKNLESNSIDSIICDPPYGIGIAGEDWDKSLPHIEIWKECFRVLKPGGFICAMSGSRLYHKLATQIESTGFITHQMMVWAYASGVPKGINLSKMIQQHDSKSLPTDAFRGYLRAALKRKGLSITAAEKKLGIRGMFSHYLGKSQPQYPSTKVWIKLKELLELGSLFDEEIFGKTKVRELVVSEESKKWSGHHYGLQTLKPSIEAIYVGQKPVEKNTVSNVLKYNTGAINIKATNHNRFPANLCHDSSLGIKKVFGKATQFFEGFPIDDNKVLYFSKAKKDEFNSHPTVKPTALMEHLVKLYTPKGGIVLDPFMGSGTTGVASLLNGYKFFGIESDPKYFEIAKRRLSLKEAI